MNTTPANDDDLRKLREDGKANNSKRKVITKLDRVISLMKTRPEGLNRFEAEGFGEHCLNSTAAVIRSIYGDKLIQRWETVPTRYCSTGVRVLRFWLVDREAA